VRAEYAGRLIELEVLNGGRTALAACDECGAAVMVELVGEIGPTASWVRHAQWHRQLMADLLPRVAP
jgi:uncharacterized protein YgbK (DUF1537 family)